jgi:peroxin-3
VKGGDEGALATKRALWRELAEAGFARTAAAVWLLPLLQLLLRVQLNILGRQLFMESNLLEPR